MHETVSSFPSRFFYEDNLNTVPMQHQHRELQFTTFDEEPLEQALAHNRLIFININTPHSTQSFKVNQPEAECIARCVYSTWHLYKTNNLPFSTYGTIGVIVPYRHQISTVRQEIDKFNIPELHDITIDTVERYQGSERDVIIYGFTVQRPYQLQFLTNNVFIENSTPIDRKLNVALTRAREQMILVGNAQILSTNEVFRKLIDFTSQNGYFSEV